MYFKLITWQLLAVANATMPDSRHDQSAWWPSDKKRRGMAGQPIVVPCACLYLKGDWSESSSTVGFPSWADGLRPCFCCNASGTDMYLAAGHTEDSLRWLENQEGEYEEACRRCMISVHIPNEAVRDQISEKLRYDKRASGSRGRALTSSLPALGLEAGDRLEPGDSLEDIGAFDVLLSPTNV